MIRWWLAGCLVMLMGPVWGQWNLDRPAPESGLSLTKRDGQVYNRFHPAVAARDSSNTVSCDDCFSCVNNTRIFAAFDTRFSRYSGSAIRMDGFKAGLDLYRKMRFGVGAYWMRGDDILLDRTLTGQNGEQDTLQWGRYSYAAFFAEYIIHQDFRWELSVPLAIGIGPRRLLRGFSEDNRSEVSSSELDTGVMTLAVDAQYNIVPWVAFGAGFGYRQSFSGEEDFKELLNQPIYSIKIKFLIGNFFKFLFARDKLEAQRDAYLEEKARRRAARGIK